MSMGVCFLPKHPANEVRGVSHREDMGYLPLLGVPVTTDSCGTVKEGLNDSMMGGEW